MTTRVLIDLVPRKNSDGVKHKYRSDLLADARLDEIPPYCDHRSANPEMHNRAFLLASNEGYRAPWCRRGCRFFPDQVWKDKE